MDRGALILEARALRARVFPECPGEGACLYEACCLQVVLGRAGLGTMIQAGTAQWPLLREEDDDGVAPNAFAYEWQGLGDRLTRDRVAAGLLPELHCWLAHRDPSTIIDTTTGTWPARAGLAGLDWTAAAPPDFLWGETEALFAEARYGGVTYAADLDACEVAGGFAQRGIYPRLINELRRIP